MTEETQAVELQEEAPKQRTPRQAKSVQIRNLSARPITLIGSNKPSDRVTILPTETADVDAKLWAVLEKNKAAMSFFDEGQLAKV